MRRISGEIAVRVIAVADGHSGVRFERLNSGTDGFNRLYGEVVSGWVRVCDEVRDELPQQHFDTFALKRSRVAMVELATFRNA
jgi:hypothetical protein